MDITAVTINTRPIALHPRRSSLSLLDVNQRKVVNIFSLIPIRCRTILSKKNSKHFKTTNFKVNYNFKEKISFNMIKNWCFVQPRLYNCGPPAIHHASLSCKLLRAVKFIVNKTVFANRSFCFCFNWLGNRVVFN